MDQSTAHLSWNNASGALGHSTIEPRESHQQIYGIYDLAMQDRRFWVNYYIERVMRELKAQQQCSTTGAMLTKQPIASTESHR
jgi:hypothetical protein